MTKKADRAGIESTSQLKVFVTIFLIVTKYAILSRLLDCRELRAFPGTFLAGFQARLTFIDVWSEGPLKFSGNVIHI